MKKTTATFQDGDGGAPTPTYLRVLQRIPFWVAVSNFREDSFHCTGPLRLQISLSLITVADIFIATADPFFKKWRLRSAAKARILSIRPTL